jgi:hypothetical protein
MIYQRFQFGKHILGRSGIVGWGGQILKVPGRRRPAVRAVRVEVRPYFSLLFCSAISALNASTRLLYSAPFFS